MYCALVSLSLEFDTYSIVESNQICLIQLKHKKKKEV